MEAQPDSKELLELFNSKGVEYIIVGAYALAHLGHPPARIDILTTISGVDWEQADKNAMLGEYGDIQVRYLGRTDFIANKRACGRPQDLADINTLESD